MKTLFNLMLLAVLCLNNPAYAQKNTTEIGKISAFECGDNCYLTIVDKKGKQHQALCSDALCEKMMESQGDPQLAGYKGKMVKVIVGKGKQVDGAGNVMGTMDEFEKIQLIQ